MEDQIGAVLHWSHQKEPELAKSKDDVIRRNLDRIAHFSCYSSTIKPIQVQPSESYSKNRRKKRTQIQKKVKNSGCQTMHPIRLKFKTYIPHHYEIIIAKFYIDR